MSTGIAARLANIGYFTNDYKFHDSDVLIAFTLHSDELQPPGSVLHIFTSPTEIEAKSDEELQAWVKTLITAYNNKNQSQPTE